MIFWLVLFLLIVAISFVFALRSMKDFQELPQKSNTEYGLFLIRNPHLLDQMVFEALHQQMLQEHLLVSLERLFKGKQAALAIFGPKKLLESFKTTLKLLELEDYAVEFDSRQHLVWEVTIKSKKFNGGITNTFQNLTRLEADDQFFWQVVARAKEGKEQLFQTQIRAVFVGHEPKRQKNFIASLQNLGQGKLTKAKVNFTNSQLISFYKLRSLGQDSQGPVILAQDLVRLISLS